jgi:hypothetical protein
MFVPLLVVGLVLMALCATAPIGAQGAPDFTKFGYPTVAKSMDLNPDQAATITAGDQSVAIKAGTFDNPVTFDLLTSEPSAWKDLVKDRTVRAAFAFRVTDKNTKALIAQFKQPVQYSYAGKDAAATDVILNTTAANPPVITVNGTPPTFDGKVNHAFGGAGVGWLVASAVTNQAAGSPAAAGTAPAGTATTGTSASGTQAPTATRPATTPVATGTGGATTLPTTGNPGGTSVSLWMPLIGIAGTMALLAGFVLRRRAVTRR